jgi:hypothetical protein
LIGRSVDHASITQQAKASTSAEEASTEEAPVEEVAEASAE